MYAQSSREIGMIDEDIKRNWKRNGWNGRVLRECPSDGYLIKWNQVLWDGYQDQDYHMGGCWA